MASRKRRIHQLVELRLISILRVRRETGLLSLRQNRKYRNLGLKLRDAALQRHDCLGLLRIRPLQFPMFVTERLQSDFQAPEVSFFSFAETHVARRDSEPVAAALTSVSKVPNQRSRISQTRRMRCEWVYLTTFVPESAVGF